MKITKVLRMLAAVLLTAMLAGTLPTIPAAATGEIISLTNAAGTSITQGSIGQVVNISGSGFTANFSTPIGVNILFGRYPIVIGTAISYSQSVFQIAQVAPLNTDGTFRNSFTIPTRLASGGTPEDVRFGDYYVYLTYYYPPSNPGDSSSNGTTVLQIAPFHVVVGAITLSPDNGAVGSNVNINGTYFGNQEGYTITYDSSVLPVSGKTAADGSFSAKITVPSGTAGQHPIIVSGNDTGVIATANFTVKPNITILPAIGSAGTLINVLGTGFGVQQSTTPTFGGDALTPARTDVFGSFAFTFGAPKKEAGSYAIAVTDGAGNSANATFNLTSTSFTVAPTTGVAGTQVSVTGSNFLPSKKVSVTFNDVQVASGNSSAQGAFSVTFTVPAIPTGTYKVKASDGTNINQIDFNIPATATISPLTSTDSPGYVGEQVTLTGAGFIPSGAAIVNYDGKEIGRTNVGSDGKFSATVTIPASTAGAHSIAVTDGTNAPPPFTFVMDSTPPGIPAPLTPEMGLKAASRTIFTWEPVTKNKNNAAELSGVTYELQVATNKDFSPSNILVEKTGLTASQYTLTADQKLAPTPKETPYYWRVRAIDGAGNQGDWSGVGSFFIANIFSLSQQAIYVLIGIGAVLVAVLGFWLGRRTAYY